MKLGIFALLSYQIAVLDIKAVSYTAIFIAPFIIGAIACGWFCLAGLVQDIVFLRRFKIEVPNTAHKWLRVVRYVFAALFIAGLLALPAAVRLGMVDIAKLKFAGNLAAWLAVVSIAASVFINRFFCRYFCPLGALAGIKSLVRPVTINRDAARCVNCKMCDKACPMKIAMSKVKSSCSPNCVDCFRCIESCPKKALYFGIRNYRAGIDELRPKK